MRAYIFLRLYNLPFVGMLMQVVPPPEALLEPFFLEVGTFNKNEGSKRGKITLANKHIANTLINMDNWITKGN